LEDFSQNPKNRGSRRSPSRLKYSKIESKKIRVYAKKEKENKIRASATHKKNGINYKV